MKIILHDGNFSINCNLLRRSKLEEHVRLFENSVLEIFGRTNLNNTSLIKGHKNAVILYGSVVINTHSALVAEKSITVGKDYLFGSGVYVFAYNYHDILDENGVPINPPCPIVIGDHVWLASKCTVSRGSKIGDGAVISANSVVAGKIRGVVWLLETLQGRFLK